MENYKYPHLRTLNSIQLEKVKRLYGVNKLETKHKRRIEAILRIHGKEVFEDYISGKVFVDDDNILPL
jgi:hypothetical protein